MNPQQQPFFGQKISKPGVNVTQATDNQLIFKNDFTTTLYYDGSGIATVLIGKRPLTGIRGFYVSKSGTDVRTATDSQLIFNSSQDIFKIVLPGTITIPQQVLPANHITLETITIPHGLPFTPILQSYVQILVTIGSISGGTVHQVSSYIPLPYIGSVYFNTGSPIIAYNIYASVDATNIYFVYFYETDNSAGYTFPAAPIKYYLLQETAN